MILTQYSRTQLINTSTELGKGKDEEKQKQRLYPPGANKRFKISRKEVFQPHLPVRLPCYDLTPVTGFTLGDSLRLSTSDTPDFHCLTGGVYKARERIHRIVADIRLLAIPAS